MNFFHTCLYVGQRNDNLKNSRFVKKNPLNLLRAGQENWVCRIRVESTESKNFYLNLRKLYFEHMCISTALDTFTNIPFYTRSVLVLYLYNNNNMLVLPVLYSNNNGNIIIDYVRVMMMETPAQWYGGAAIIY